jgi:single-strand DNA-binding protein
MRGVNKAILVGRLGRDPESKFMTGGSAVCSFAIATDEEWKAKDGSKQKRTDWHNCTAFGKLAEICAQYLKKGSPVYVEGKIRTDAYEKDGQKRYATKIIVSEMQMLGKNEGHGEQRTQAEQVYEPAAEDVQVAEEDLNDDIPF